MPLDALIAHIDSLIKESHESERELEKIPFSSIRLNLQKAIASHRNGLKIIRNGLTESLMKKAEIIASLPSKSGKSYSVEQVMYTFFPEIISASYITAERLNTDITMLAKTGIVPELYYWLLEIPENFSFKKSAVLREGERFLTETFNQRIIAPLQTLIDLAKKPDVDGSLAQVGPIDLTKTNPVEEGYIVSCVRGEAQSPIMWPILCHEMFELVDMEQGILKNFKEFVSTQSKELPVFDPDSQTNERWILEILMDFLAMTSFGPMYARSLLEYCKRSPYYPTPQYPEMCSRLYCAYLYLLESFRTDSDIFHRCQKKAREDVEQEIQRYETNEDLDTEKKTKLGFLCSLMEQFCRSIKILTFLDRLEKHVGESENSKTTLKEILKNEDLFLPFKDPVMTFGDINNNVLLHHISLAIDPNILLNVVIANYDSYQKEAHLKIIIDSIKKWKVKQAWNSSVDNLLHARTP